MSKTEKVFTCSQLESYCGVEGSRCPECHSNRTLIIRGALTCIECGVVLESRMLETEFNEDIFYSNYMYQHGISSNWSDSIQRHVGARYKRLDSSKNLEPKSYRGRSEIARILLRMGLEKSFIEKIMVLFYQLMNAIPKKTKFQNAEKLACCAILGFLRIHCINFKEDELLSLSMASQQDLQSFKALLSRYIPQYTFRDRKRRISSEIWNFVDDLKLPNEFFQEAMLFLQRAWSFISNTSDAVISVKCCAVILHCSDVDIGSVRLSISDICKYFGCSENHLTDQLKRDFNTARNIPKFMSLKKTPSILKSFLLEKWLLLEPKSPPLQGEKIRIKLVI